MSDKPPERVTLGFRSHSGWTVAVAVTNSTVLERRRFETADPSIPGSKQPFHAAENLEPAPAAALIQRCQESSTKLATNAIRLLVNDLTQTGHKVVGAGIIAASGRPLPELPAILKSHALIHTAEGEFFRDALARASEQCGLPVTRVKEREATAQAEQALHVSQEELQWRMSRLGKTLGPPWRQDEKLAALAAWIVLASAESQ